YKDISKFVKFEKRYFLRKMSSGGSLFAAMCLTKLKKQSRNNKELLGIAFNILQKRLPLFFVKSCGNAVAGLLIDIAPVFKGPLRYRFGHPGLQVANNIRYQPVPGGFVHHFADQCSGLSPVVIFRVFAIGSVHKLSACR